MIVTIFSSLGIMMVMESNEAMDTAAAATK